MQDGFPRRRPTLFPARCSPQTGVQFLIKSHGRELVCLNFLLFHQQVAPLTLIAKLRSPHTPIGEIEEHGRLRFTGRLDAPDCVISFRGHTALPLIASSEIRI